MGQAKQRGTLDERRAAAIERRKSYLNSPEARALRKQHYRGSRAELHAAILLATLAGGAL